jgi:hypothetical protein
LICGESRARTGTIFGPARRAVTAHRNSVVEDRGDELDCYGVDFE